MDLVEAMQTGQINFIAGEKAASAISWNDHPSFPGGSLKHLVTGKETNGTFSTHLVRVKKGCEIGQHIHAGKWELHEVARGQGQCIMNDHSIEYGLGVIAAIPPDLPHVVKAFDEDLYLLAKFIPALL